jgi:hypothetical protein
VLLGSTGVNYILALCVERISNTIWHHYEGECVYGYTAQRQHV